MDENTRECPSPKCDAIIGKTEKTCPKCSVEIADYDEQIDALENAQNALTKRQKTKAVPAPTPTPTPTPVKKTLFGGLTKLVKRK